MAGSKREASGIDSWLRVFQGSARNDATEQINGGTEQLIGGRRHKQQLTGRRKALKKQQPNAHFSLVATIFMIAPSMPLPLQRIQRNGCCSASLRPPCTDAALTHSTERK